MKADEPGHSANGAEDEPVEREEDDFDGPWDDLEEDMAEDLGDMFWDDEEYAVYAFSLTVAESKRLIAKGLVADPRIEEARDRGTIAICKGTTNAYIVEELLGKPIEKGHYVLGRTLPEGSKAAQRVFEGPLMPDVVLREGTPVEGLTIAEAVKQMGPGDVVLKGANALDYPNGAAAVLVGHPEGGTMGAILGHVYGKGITLIVPVGLEKQVATPMALLSKVTFPEVLARNDIPRLWPIPGMLFTEIEALRVLADVETVQIGAGGVCGAEGAVWLMASGLEEDIEHVKTLIKGLRGEPSFLDAAKKQK